MAKPGLRGKFFIWDNTTSSVIIVTDIPHRVQQKQTPVSLFSAVSMINLRLYEMSQMP